MSYVQYKDNKEKKNDALVIGFYCLKKKNLGGPINS